MKNFKGGGGFGGGQRFGGGNNKNHERNGGGKFGGGQSRGFKGGDRSKDRNERGEMFSATCSTCGKPCEVPFRPSPDKPVYCSACFGKKSQEMSREFGSKDKGVRREPEFKRDSRPLRDERPARNEQSNDGGHEELKRQLSSLEGKVNRILDMLNAQMHEDVAPAASGVSAGMDAPKKGRKPKLEKVAVVTKKVAKKAAKTVKKVAKKAKK